MRRLLSILVAAFVCTVSGRALAAEDGFRCPDTGRLIALKDSTMLVRKKCREPDDRERYEEKRRVRRLVQQQIGGVWTQVWVEDEVSVRVEKWFYDFGSQAFVRTLYFENEALARVESGGYGEKGK